MKKLFFLLAIIVSLLSFAGYGFTDDGDYQENNIGQGNRMMRERIFQDGTNDLRGPMMGNHGFVAGFYNPEIVKIIENYRLKIQKIFLDARQSKVGLDLKRRELYIKLSDLAEKYSSDKSVSKEILSIVKDLNVIQNQIRDINQDAMKKIQALNEEREKEIETANDLWIKKLETDSRELEKYVNFIKDRSYRFTNR